jgi:hypothetical protein
VVKTASLWVNFDTLLPGIAYKTIRFNQGQVVKDGLDCAERLSMLVLLFLIQISSMALASDDQSCATAAAINIAQVCKDATTKNFENIINHPQYDTGIPAYTDSMGPTLEDRLRGLKEQEANALATLQAYSPKTTDLYTALSEQAKSPVGYSRDHATQFSAQFDKQVRTDQTTLAGFKIGGAEGCGVLNTGCKKAFNALADLMSLSNIDNGGVLSLPSIWKEIGTDSRYQKPLAAVAVKLASKIKAMQSGKSQDAGDLFTDIQSEFVASGISQSDSTEMTWKTLALYATRGASGGPFFSLSDKENAGTFSSVALMASDISCLDGLSLPKGKIYSLPASIKTTCDYTRPYHPCVPINPWTRDARI